MKTGLVKFLCITLFKKLEILTGMFYNDEKGVLIWTITVF